jgi:ABC-type amino acid transport substrate-binding protein
LTNARSVSAASSLVVFCSLLLPTPNAGAEETPLAEQTHLARIRAAGVLRIATNPGIEPMEVVRDGELVGYDIDLGNQLARRMGLEVEWISFQRLEDLLRPVSEGDFAGRFDIVISAVGIDRERTEKALALPYFKSGLTILAASSNHDISDLASLSGKRVAAVVGSTEHGFLTPISGVTVVEVGNYAEGIEKVESGDVDAAVMDVPVALLAAARAPDRLRAIPKPFEDEWYGIYLEKTSPALFHELRRQLREMEDESVLDALRKDWF